jgi:hypothetical protein
MKLPKWLQRDKASVDVEVQNECTPNTDIMTASETYLPKAIIDEDFTDDRTTWYRFMTTDQIKEYYKEKEFEDLFEMLFKLKTWLFKNI